MQQRIRKISLFALLLILCLSMIGCQLVIDRHEGDGTSPLDSATEPAAPDTVDTPDTPPATEDDTTVPPETEPAVSETETDEPETTDVIEIPDEPEFIHPLTGLAADADLSAKRPVAIMINNLRASCPQESIDKADIVYECLVEGGITRLMMVVLDYEKLPEVGSIRSARDYYLNFAADYDALFVHAGGSPFAYASIKDRKVNNLDGVNMWDIEQITFYRSKDRMKTMGYEHSMVSDGEKIAAGVKYKKYRTDLTENFDYPLDFVKFGESVSYDKEATSIHIPLSISQVTDFVYDAERGEYLRYQFNGEKHVEGTTGEQLSFKNVMILFCKTGAITGDPKYRIDVETVGEGSGYYAVNGTYTKIKWVKDSNESPIRFYSEDGEPLLMNPGKTFITVSPTSIESLVSMNYNK